MSIIPLHTDSQGVVYLGDCAEVLPAAGVKADLILTSPPYDNLRDYGGHGFDFDRVADACIGALKPGGVIVWVVTDATVDGSETGTSFRQALGFMARGLRLHDTMIWEKTNPVPIENRGQYRATWEYMFLFSKGLPATVNLIYDKPTVQPNAMSGRGIRQPDGHIRNSPSGKSGNYQKRTNIWRYPTPANTSGHPAPMPYLLAADHVRTWTNPGDLVLDPMAGSGTVLRAAKDLGRQYVGIEIHQPYTDIIRDRLAQEVLIGHV